MYVNISQYLSGMDEIDKNKAGPGSNVETATTFSFPSEPQKIGKPFPLKIFRHIGPINDALLNRAFRQLPDAVVTQYAMSVNRAGPRLAFGIPIPKLLGKSLIHLSFHLENTFHLGRAEGLDAGRNGKLSQVPGMWR